MLMARTRNVPDGEVEGVSGAEAAARLGMTVGAVFMAKANVLRMLREEIRDLDDNRPREAAGGQDRPPPPIEDRPG